MWPPSRILICKPAIAHNRHLGHGEKEIELGIVGIEQEVGPVDEWGGKHRQNKEPRDPEGVTFKCYLITHVLKKVKI